MPTTKEYVRKALAMFGCVPKSTHDFVCKCCLGPVGPGFTRCYACNSLFVYGSAPVHTHDIIVVPMTSALNPSIWYTWLQTYKSGHPERGAELVCLVHEYLTTHAVPIRELLGGEPSMLTIVPSKRGHTFATQPLRQALSRVQPIAARLKQTLTFVSGATIGRREYSPDAFGPGLTSVQGERVILIEDSWVTSDGPERCWSPVRSQRRSRRDHAHRAHHRQGLLGRRAPIPRRNAQALRSMGCEAVAAID